MTALTRATWRKSSYSSGENDGQCVELKPGAIRDSKNPDEVIEADLTGFLAAVKADTLRR